MYGDWQPVFEGFCLFHVSVQVVRKGWISVNELDILYLCLVKLSDQKILPSNHGFFGKLSVMKIGHRQDC